MTTATETQPTLTLSNFRVQYRAPRYDDGRVLYDGYCAILADDAALDGAEVRVFDVPDVDEGQLAAALFACDAMNRYERLVEALQRWIAEPKCASPTCCGNRGYHDSLLFNAKQAIDSIKLFGSYTDLNWKLQQAEQERDAARTENERLNAQLKDWQEEKDTKAGYL